MSNTLLQLVAAASAELSLTVPASVAGNTDANVQQMYYLANAVGNELQQEYDWQQLSVEYRFTTVFYVLSATTTSGSASVTVNTTGLDNTFMITGSGISQDCWIQSVDSPTTLTMNQPATSSGTVSLTFSKQKYTLPVDYARQTENTQWDKSKHWIMQGPLTPQEWQWIKSGYVSTWPRIVWRMLGGYMQLFPAVSTNEYLGIEYMSSYWARDNSGNSKAQFSNDTDVCIFPDRLMILALKKKYLDSHNFDSSTVTADYKAHLSIAKAANTSGRTLSMAPRRGTSLITDRSLPDTGYGQ